MLLTEIFDEIQDLFEKWGMPTGYLRAAITKDDNGVPTYNWIPMLKSSTGDTGEAPKSGHYKLSSYIYSFENPNFPKPASMNLNRQTAGGSSRVAPLYRGFQREAVNISKDKTIKHMSDGLMKALKYPGSIITADGDKHTINTYNANRILRKAVSNIVKSKYMDSFKGCYIVWPQSSSSLAKEFAHLLADGVNATYGGSCVVVGAITQKRSQQDVHNDVEAKIPPEERGGKYSVHIADPWDMVNRLTKEIDKLDALIPKTKDPMKLHQLENKRRALQHRWDYEYEKVDKTGGGPAKMKGQFNGGRAQLRKHNISLHSFSGGIGAIPPKSNVIVVDDFRTSGGTLLDTLEMVVDNYGPMKVAAAVIMDT